jgi:hypothetical protein
MTPTEPVPVPAWLEAGVARASLERAGELTRQLVAAEAEVERLRVERRECVRAACRRIPKVEVAARLGFTRQWVHEQLTRG